MALTNGQKKAIHAAARQAGIPEDMRRTVQQRIGGFWSAADATASRQGFIAVMAFHESRCGGRLARCTPGYWSAEDARANPTDSLVYRIRAEASALGMTEAGLDAFLAGEHMSRGACESVATAPAYWLRKLLQGLIEIRKRRHRPQDRRATA